MFGSTLGNPDLDRYEDMLDQEHGRVDMDILYGDFNTLMGHIEAGIDNKYGHLTRIEDEDIRDMKAILDRLLEIVDIMDEEE